MNYARSVPLHIAALFAFVPLALPAAEDIITGVSPAWGTATSWSLGAIPGLTDNAVINATGTVDIRGSTLGGLTEIQDLSFIAPASMILSNESTSADMVLAINGGRGAGVPLLASTGDFTYTINGINTAATPHIFTIQLKASGDISVAGAGRLEVLPALTEDAPGRTLNKIGTGVLTLGGASTITGNVTVNGGTLEIFNTTGAGTGAVIVNASSLALRNVTINNPVTMNGGQLLTRTGDLSTFAGPVNLTANTTTVLRSYTTPANDQSLTISGVLSGGVAFTIDGNASNAVSGKALILTNTGNTFSGSFNVNAGGALRTAPISAGSALGSAVVNLNGGALQLQGLDGTIYLSNVVLGAGGGAIDVLTNATLSGLASGSSGLRKTGAGSLVLTRANTYSGPTDIDGGTLAITGSLNNSSRFDVKAGATLDVSGAAGGFVLAGAQTLAGSGTVNGTVTIGNAGRIEAGDATGAGTLSVSGLVLGQASANTSTLRVGLNGTAPGINVTTANGLRMNSGAGKVTVNVVGPVPGVGQYPLLDYSGTMQGTGFAAFVLGSLPTSRVIANLINNLTASSVDLNVTGTDFPVWSGRLSPEWSTATLPAPKNWVLNSNPSQSTDFFQNDIVVFNDSAANTQVNVSVSDVTPFSMTFNNSTKNYTLGGTQAIAGATGLTKTGTGSVTISNTNTFTGAVALNGGMVSVPAIANSAVSSPLGAGTDIAFDGSTLEFTGATGSTNRPLILNAGGGTLRTSANATLTVAGLVSGAGSLTKTGPGTVSFIGAAKTYANTIISSGTLQVGEGALATAPGTGTITDDAALVFNHSNALTINNTISGLGTVTKLGTGTLTLGGTEDNTYTGVTRVTGGTLIAGKTAGINAVSGDLIVETGAAFRYTGDNVSNQIADTASITLNGGNFGDPAVTPVNPGAADTVTNLTINSGQFNSGRNVTQGLFIITDRLKVTGGTLLCQRGGGVSANTVEMTGGVINLDGGSTTGGSERSFEVGAGGISLSSGTINFNTGPSALTAGSQGSMVILNGDLTSTGTTTFVRPAAGLVVTRALVDLGGGQRIFNVQGTLDMGTPGAEVSLTNGGLTKTGSGTLTLPGANDYFGDTEINAGTLVLTGTISGTARIDVKAGAVFDVRNAAAGFTLVAGQTILGNGTVLGDVRAEGSVAPGASIGTLHFTGGLTLAGTADFEINKTGALRTADLADVTGALVYGGALNVLATGAALALGDTFNLFDATSFSGAFASMSLPPLGPGLFWQTNNLPSNGTLVVVPEPAGIVSLLGGATALLLGQRRRSRRG